MTEEFDSARKIDGKPEVRKREIEPLYGHGAEVQRGVNLETEGPPTHGEP